MGSKGTLLGRNEAINIEITTVEGYELENIDIFSTNVKHITKVKILVALIDI